MQRRPTLARFTTISALMLFAVPVAASAQTLPDALVSAYNNNPQLQAERATLRATDEAVPQALANWRPTVQLSTSGGIEHNGFRESCTQTSGGFSPCNGAVTAAQQAQLPLNFTTTSNLSPQTTSLTIQQPIYRGGRTEAQTQQALAQVRSERAHLVSIEQTVLLNAVTDYMNVVRDQAEVDLNINNEQVLRRQLEAAQDRFRVGEVTRTDVAQAEAAYAQAIAGRETAEGQLQISRAGYERDIGELPGKLVAPQGVPELPTSRDEFDGHGLDQQSRRDLGPVRRRSCGGYGQSRPRPAAADRDPERLDPAIQ